MHFNKLYAVLAGALSLAQGANAQQVPAAPAQLKAPGQVAASVKAAEPAGVAPKGAPAAAGNAAATAALSAGAAPAGSPNVFTLGQVASSAPAAVQPAATGGINPVPPIEPMNGNAVLATGADAKLMDPASPRRSSPEAKEPKPRPISLMRISYTDSETRALLKIHGVTRFVEVGSKVKKLTVTNISDDGVCLSDLAKKTAKKGKGDSTPGCAQLITFQE